MFAHLVGPVLKVINSIQPHVLQSGKDWNLAQPKKSHTIVDKTCSKNPTVPRENMARSQKMPPDWQIILSVHNSV